MKLFLYILTSFFCFIEAKVDVSIIGIFKFADGLGRDPIIWTDILKEKLKLCCMPVNNLNIKDVNFNLKELCLSKPYYRGEKKLVSDVSVYVMNLNVYSFYRSKVNKAIKSKIKLSYSMHESTEISKSWVDILNKDFDGVIVPDEWLVDIYKKSGVNIPIFVLPLAEYLESFLDKPVKKTCSDKFKFGVSATFIERKNHDLLIDAFEKEFGNDENVILKIHGRYGELLPRIKEKVKKLELKNIEILSSEFSHKDYLNFMSDLDCYVFLSRGEGFSHTPREALALGIPCILSNNTAHKTICKTGYVRAVESNVLKRAKLGFDFDCKVDDVCRALRDVYTNRQAYKQKAMQGRSWVEKYLRKNLQDYYLSVVKPGKIILGDKNIIGQDYLMTNSEDLYYKYLELK